MQNLMQMVLFLCLLCYLMCEGKIEKSLKASPSINIPDQSNYNRIESLRKQGKELLFQKSYAKAYRYYAAVLQLAEGFGDIKHRDIRKRCILTLADCDMKAGRLHEAVARCTDFIEEFSPRLAKENITDNSESFGVDNVSLAKALYRRGVSLVRLGRTDLALFDLRAAVLCDSTDEKTKRVLENVEVNLGPDKLNEASIDSRDSELWDIVEEGQQSYVSLRLTKVEIDKLLQPANSAPGSSRSGLDMGFGLSDLLGSSGGENGMDGLSRILPLVQTLTGIDSKIITEIGDYARMFMDFVKKAQRVMDSLKKHSRTITAGFVLLWIISSVFGFVFS